MSYETSWLVDKRVLYVRSFGTRTIAELKQMSVDMRTICETGIPFVYVINDATEQAKMEFKLQDVLNIFRGSPPPISTVGWSVYVSSNSVNRFFFSIVSQLTSGKFRAFATLEEAIAFIQEQDDTLPAIPQPQKAAKV